MQVVCGQCRQTLEVDEQLAVGSVVCPHCEHRIPIAASQGPAGPGDGDDAQGEGFAAAAQEAMLRKIRVVCGSCGKSLLVAPRLSGKTRPCPACTKPIRIPDLGEADEFAVAQWTAEAEDIQQLDLADVEREMVAGAAQSQARRRSARKASKTTPADGSGKWRAIGVAVIGFVILMAVIVLMYWLVKMSKANRKLPPKPAPDVAPIDLTRPAASPLETE